MSIEGISYRVSIILKTPIEVHINNKIWLVYLHICCERYILKNKNCCQMLNLIHSKVLNHLYLFQNSYKLKEYSKIQSKQS